ncbi:uncharacterized protein PAC_06479 [Phialocephala subalpina]|uniref:Uncharacterized protein n=1 Tax=Phialocephala subalpina TaxID=576137 RepID=A0A1L7WUZ6_9HELO|nr:uncharacterized protein PAC_06479 [Phialocephala subalpina]
MPIAIGQLRDAPNLFAKPSPFIRISENYGPNAITKAESKKKIIEKSFWVALRRCAVHLIPVTFSLVIITLNLKGYYIGADFVSPIHSETINLLLFQVAAKAQEILVIASLTTIIFHIARQELLFGNGLPLGLIGSGLLFSDFSYFFSKEFLGSLSYQAENIWRKWSFVAVLVAAGLTAALAGPSSATLLVPKSQYWQAGGTSFYLNGNTSDFWPTYLTSNEAASQPYCFGPDATRYGTCPSGGFHSLWQHFGQVDSSNFMSAGYPPSYAKPLSGSPFYWSIDSPLSQVPPVYTLGGPRPLTNDKVQDYTFFVQPHAATTIMLQQITTDWWDAFLSKDRMDPNRIDDRLAQTRVLSPLAQARCSAPQNLSSTDLNIQFPTLSGDGWVWRVAASLPVNTLNTTASDHLRFQWVHLPDQFGAATIGAVFESPWTSDNSSRFVIGCTVFSAYFNASLFTDEYSFWSGWYPWDVDFGHRYPAFDPGLQGNPANGRIGVNDTWLNLLTPPTPPDGPGYYSWQPSTIESIMMNAGLQNTALLNNQTLSPSSESSESSTPDRQSVLLETIICSVFVDGLSRSGSAKVYNNTGSVYDWTLSAYNKKPDFEARIVKGQDALNPPISPSGDFTKLRINMKISGFAYQGSIAEYLSMVVLLVHIAFALSHTVWILSTKQTSDSWDSVSKLLVLAQNSRPFVGVLKNASANIDHLATYSQKAKIRVTQPPGSEKCDHVELLFSGEDRRRKNSKARYDSIEGVDLSDVPANETSIQPPIFEEPSEDLHFNDQHRYPQTWPGISSSDDSSTTTLSELRRPGRQNSTASLLSNKTSASFRDITTEVERDQEYG